MQHKSITASDITKSAIKELTWKGYKVWRHNQIRVPGRAFIGERGAADITGYCKKSGVRVECEVKTKTDRLSNEQIEFLSEAKKAGCITLIATVNEKGNIIVNEFNPSL